jgi:hypothetical protein
MIAPLLVCAWLADTEVAPTDPPPPEMVEGAPAPPTAAGTRPHSIHVRPGIEAFGQYALRWTNDGQDTRWFHQFDVPRVHASLEGDFDNARARVVLEGVRSTGEGSLVGVAGDSVVLRLREAFAAYRFDFGLEGAAGIVPTFTVPEMDGTWMLRVVSASTLEVSGLGTPADLGATARYTLPKKLGWVGLGAYNGEGYARRELNRGKTLEGAAEVHPLATVGVLPLALFASYTYGSSGVDSARADRLTAGVLWQGKKLRAGALLTYGWGVGPDGQRNAVVLDSFLRVDPFGPLVFGARASSWLRNATTGDSVTTFTVSAGVKIAAPLEVHLIGARSIPSSTARDAVPGSDFTETRLATRIVF